MGKTVNYCEVFKSAPDPVQMMFVDCVTSGDYGIAKAAVLSLEYIDTCKCRSPIEIVFAYAYKILTIAKEVDWALWLDEQVKIATTSGRNYVADFVFTTERDFVKRDGTVIKAKKPLKLIVECDGHDYHEKTKEQVIRRNERDYDLMKDGYEVLHYSGTQIYKDPIGCAIEVFSFVKNKTGGTERVNGDLQKRPDGILDGCEC